VPAPVTIAIFWVIGVSPCVIPEAATAAIRNP
jgi:hypothetical protein